MTSFITYNALGEAILRANKPTLVQNYRRPGTGTEHSNPMRSVVLIDEIDKAPRDVPNDILSEIDRLEFEIPELSLLKGEPVKITAADEFRPIVIITSNQEKSLPDAFLRRCVYYHLKFPGEDQLKKIIASRLGARYKASSAFFDSALAFCLYLRQPQIRLNKPPATAELLDWLYVLVHSLAEDAVLPAHVAEHPRLEHSLKCTLLKTTSDQARADELITELKKTKAPSA